jgi:hypothetical protein
VILADPVDPSEFEISILGPGVGECIVVHLGGGDWIVVDSCVDQASRQNAALKYFQQIGVDPAESVRLVIATHAHDDHVSGISDIVLEAQSADFVCPAASTEPEFVALLELDAGLLETRHRIYSEFQRVFHLLEDRKPGAHYGVRRKRAVSDRLLWCRPPQSGLQRAAVTALSPSDHAIDLSLRALRFLIPKAGSTPRQFASRDPNTFSVALWIEVGDVSALLGSDLLKGPGPSCGWNAILANPQRPTSEASVYKVPHHGAPNAHHEGVWTSLCADDVIAILAPYRAGRQRRPSLADAKVICSLAEQAYITAPSSTPALGAASRAQRWKLSDVASAVREREGPTGHVRLRYSLDRGGPWRVTVGRPARSLCEDPPPPRPRKRRRRRHQKSRQA